MEDGKFLITVIDGQGGGIGKAIIEGLSQGIPQVHIRALGTNAIATSAMIRAGARDGATGENAVVCNVAHADIIMGPVGIIMPNGLLGEVTAAMAGAIGGSAAQKLLIPSNQCNLYIVLQDEWPVQKYIAKSIQMAKALVEKYEHLLV